MSAGADPLAAGGGLLLRRKPDGWNVGLLLLTAVLCLPFVSILLYALQPSGEVWRHLAETVLPEYLRNSALLAGGVAAGTLLIGVPTAWLCAHFSFPGRQRFEWLLLLPLAVPTYIVAYTYTGLLEFSGPVQSTLRSVFDLKPGHYWFPQIRSLPGAIALFSLVLYPYVFMLAKAAFLEQSSRTVEVSRSLGAGPWRHFWNVTLPLARPGIVAGLALALMETLADYGAVKYFGIPTFTTGIYRTWLGLGNGPAAAQLSTLLLAMVFMLVFIERRGRMQARFHHIGQTGRIRHQRASLHGLPALFAVAACALPILLGFVLPSTQLLLWVFASSDTFFSLEFLSLSLHSLGLSMTAAVITVSLALLLAYGARYGRSGAVRLGTRIAGLGYAVPGTVMAVGVMLPFAWFDNTVDGYAREWLGISTGLILSGTLIAPLFAYCVRFLSVALQSVESGLSKIRPSMDDAARSLGCTTRSALKRVHIPLLRTTVISGLLLVFVDAMKELPATLILRPFDFNTLAVRTYELASDERLADAASPALLIVLAGIIPLLILNRSLQRLDDVRTP